MNNNDQGEFRGTTLRNCLCVIAALVCLAIPASTAAADPTLGVMNAAGGIYWRSAPDWNTPVQTVGFGFYPDTVIAVHCYQAGAGNVPGSADYMWEYATDVGGSGFGTGWINEHFINDGQPINQPSPGVPPCGGSAPAPPPAPAPAPAPAPGPSPGGGSIASFNRSATVKWAMAHARDTPPHPASCTWFVSQALWQGGLQKTSEWTSAGSHGLLQKRPGSVAAWAVPDFVNYFLRKYPHSTFTQLNFAANKVPAAQPGDVIAYDWYGKSSPQNRSNLQHLSLVTSIQPGEYPEVAEWSIFDGTQATPYVSRGWTWSTKTHQWLQKEYPQVEAFLLHINTN